MIKKILIGIGIVIGALILLALLSVAAMKYVVSSERGNKEKILSSSEMNAKKALIIYQPGLSSFPGGIADQIARGLNESGYEVTLNYPGKHLSTDISKYSLVIFGSPVYVSQASTALTNYMSKITGSQLARIVLFTTGDMEETTVLDAMEKSLNGTKAYNKVKFYSNKKEESEKNAYTLGQDLAKE